jgi:hypothetical protein
MRQIGCVACGESYRDKRLEPYCSCVCRTIGQAGLGWRLDPARIIDVESGSVLTTSPSFDLTPRGLEYLMRLAERVRLCAPQNVESVLIQPVDSQTPPAVPEFIGSAV